MTDRILCVGNIVRDEVFHIQAFPEAGVKVDVLHYEDRFGGPAATAAVAVARLNGRVSYWGRVGADPAGDAALLALRRHGVECGGVEVVAGARTRRSVVLVDHKGERSILVDRRGLPDGDGRIPDDPLDDVAVALVDSRWPTGAERAMERARAKRITTVFDADGGDQAANVRLIEKAGHVVFSAEGLRDFAGEGDADDLLRKCATRSNVVGVTRGSAGSLWFVEGEVAAVPAYAVTIADTTGCGDVFHGAYALALAEGEPPLSAARFASAAAAIKAQRGKGWEGMPDRRSIREMIAQPV